MNTLSSVISHYLQGLSAVYDKEEIRSITFLVLEQVLGLTKIDLLKNDFVIDEKRQLRLESVLKDLQQHKPVQYILGETEFYGLKFNVNEHVLIPRQETEELVDWILKDLKGKDLRHFSIMDIGTGSGCIPIALKKQLVDPEVCAIDISENALALATENARLNETEVCFILHDVFADDGKLPNVNLIVSNPPYILDSEKAQMHNNVLDFEPHLALFVPDIEALVYYEAVAELALNKLKRPGLLYFEINEAKGKELCDMLLQKGFTNVVLRKDLNSKNRMVKCQLL